MISKPLPTARPPSPRPAPPRRRLRVFASHDWGADGATHARVARVVEALRARRVDVWFDETHMRGNILDAMCAGIDKADVVLVFVTENYLRKAASGDARDNVRREFMYAAAHAAARLLPVRFETTLPRTWPGPVGMVLGAHLYIDLAPRVDATALDTLLHACGRTALDALRRDEGTKTRVRCAPPTDPRERARGVLAAASVVVGHNEHTADALDRLLRSLRGAHNVGELPFVAKVALAERELGL
jgi:hypothetical protein